MQSSGAVLPLFVSQAPVLYILPISKIHIATNYACAIRNIFSLIISQIISIETAEGDDL